MNNPSPTYKRRIYFIEKSFQAKFILRFCSLVALAGLLTIVMVYFLAMRSTTVSIVNSRVLVKTTADFMLPILIQTIIVVVVIASLATIVVTLLASHKIAGPLYRFKRSFEDLSNGDFSKDVKIRRFDQLQDVADAFNNMILKVRAGIKGIKEDVAALDQKIKEIPESEAANQAKRISDELNKKISRFKT